MIFTNIAYAQSPGVDVAVRFVEKLNDVILFPLIALLTGIALLVFIYGSFLYVANAESSDGRETGKRHIMYGIIGMFVMLTAFAILSLAANTFGLGQRLDCSDNPGLPGCDTVFTLPDGGGDRGEDADGGGGRGEGSIDGGGG